MNELINGCSAILAVILWDMCRFSSSWGHVLGVSEMVEVNGIRLIDAASI